MVTASRCGAALLAATVVSIGLIGALLLIVAFVMLSEPERRETAVRTYNDAVSAFNNASSSNFSAWASGTIGGIGVTLRAHVPIDIRGGDTSDVSQGYSTYASALVPRSSIAGDGIVMFNVGRVVPFLRVPVLSKTKTTPINCTSTACTSNCDDENSAQCSFEKLSEVCRTEFAGTFDGTRTCYVDEACGSCSYTAYLETHYTVVKQDTANVGYDYVVSSVYQSALYDFGANQQDYVPLSAPANIEFRVYSDKDPLLVLERVTEGSRDFGPSEAEIEQKADHLMRIGIPCVVQMVVIGAIAMVVKRHRERQRELERQQAYNVPEKAPSSTTSSCRPIAGAAVGIDVHATHDEELGGLPPSFQATPHAAAAAGVSPAVARMQEVYDQV